MAATPAQLPSSSKAASSPWNPRAAPWPARPTGSSATAGASGGQTIASAPGFGESTNNPSSEEPARIVSYDFATSGNSGNYSLYARVYFPSASADSFFWRIAGQSWNRVNNDNGAGAMWIRLSSNQSLSGSNRLELTYRESGSVIDKFVFVRNGTPAPTGQGPAETR